jgi:deoxycytidine triphosphate deaminase
MTILNEQRAEAAARQIVHADTQRGEAGFDLTVDELFVLNGKGALDFGGSEFKPASYTRLEAELADPEDDYGWWNVEAGSYLIRFNESVRLEEDEVGFIYPHRRLLAAGLQHPAFVVDESLDEVSVLIQCTGPGARIKENARVSTLVVAEKEAE